MTEARRQVKASRVKRELVPGQSKALLQALHLLTRDGNLNADSLRKLKQVNHLVGLLTPALDEVFERFGAAAVVDVGSGNGYLGFILYELFFQRREAGELLSVETKPELVARARERAGSLGFGRMKFLEGAIEKAEYPERVHMLTALHACDTATDDALYVAISRGVDHVAVVPCCQAEVAQQLKESRVKVEAPVGALFQHAWHRREFGSHLTNVIRALALEAHGYQVTVTELAGWEHSLKNELILARRVHKESREGRAKLDALLMATGVKPKLIRLLEGAPGAA